ncbi:MAG: GntR family transcriptional regulator, partial [Comamonas sp.]|nr:GntR family transcriptional regulator [Comamonas sp.]
MLDAHIDGGTATPVALPVAATASLGWQPMRSSAAGLVEQLVEHFGGLIRNHGLRVGVRLPSVRALAESAGVSRDTVVQAYDKL